MLSRGPNSSILKDEGYNVTPELSEVAASHAAPYKMSWWYNYVDRNHASEPRPVVDVSVPPSYLDETQQSRKFGTQKLLHGFFSMSEFSGMYEDAPYTETHHTSEIVRIWMLALNVWQASYFIDRSIAAAAVVSSPRTYFAWRLAFLLGLVRANIAGLIGVGGYFYSYEFLYTHGPWPFRIRDPTPNGWKRAWEEGQSCFCARTAASVWPALGYAFYKGRWKRAGTYFGLTVAAGLVYEYARIHINPGNRLLYNYMAHQQMQREALQGSLAPQTHHLIDPDTNRNESVAQFRYFRLSSGALQSTVWENAANENIPFYPGGFRIPNPYFNWVKAPQNFNPKPFVVKNDMWQLPAVLDPSTRAGAWD